MGRLELVIIWNCFAETLKSTSRGSRGGHGGEGQAEQGDKV